MSTGKAKGRRHVDWFLFLDLVIFVVLRESSPLVEASSNAEVPEAPKVGVGEELPKNGIPLFHLFL